jgi:hypothetical protein
VSEKQVPVVRTDITVADYVRASVRGGLACGLGLLPEVAIGVLFAQYRIETGGTNCFGSNIGNVKKVPGDGFDYHCLRGVWEGVSPAEAQRLIANGEAVADPSANHAKAVGAGRVSVIFNPPHPQTRFRYYPSLDIAMQHHLELLAKKRYASCWPAVLAGDVDGFARTLKAKGYFTADAGAYAAGMRTPFAKLVATTTYEELIATMNEAPETIEVETPEHEAVFWDREDQLANLISVMHQGASNVLAENMREEWLRRPLTFDE